MVKKIAVLGAGSFGTAMAFIASHKYDQVNIFCRDPEQARHINKHHVNPKRMSDFILPSSIVAFDNVKDAIDGIEMIIHAIPVQNTIEFVSSICHILPSVPYISTSKGICIDTHEFVSSAIERAMDGRASYGEDLSRPNIPLAFISGPSFAKEIMSKHPISLVVASKDKWCSDFIQSKLSSNFLRIYTTDDVDGVEIGGALKNPMAIAAGIARGLGYGNSSIAALVTRGCMEMKHFARALGARDETVSGLSGIGDLMLTCYSSMSRNNRFGELISQGISSAEACNIIGEVVEGLPTANEIVLMAKKRNIKLPLYFLINKILQNNITAKEALEIMMSAKLTEERFIT